jgi:hypothetical protein
MTDRKKPAVAFWATMVGVAFVFLAYPLSVGPVQWLDDRGRLPNWADNPIAVIYAPLDWIIQHSDAAHAAADWYIRLWVDDDDDAPGMAVEADNDAGSHAPVKNPVAKDVMVLDADLVGEWEGIAPAGANRAFADIHPINDPDVQHRDMLQIDFIIVADPRMTAMVRLAKYESGIVTLDDEISGRGIESDLPFTALVVMKTEDGEFLVPIRNAEMMKSPAELKPGFAFKRKSEK